jgi:hypothetical protein
MESLVWLLLALNGGNCTIFDSPCLRSPNAHWGLEKQGDLAPALPSGSIPYLVSMEPPYFGPLVDFSQARWTPAI